MRAETHSDELVQEGEDFGSIRVLLGQGDDCTFEDGHNQLSMAGTNGRLDKDRVDRFTERTVEVVVPDVEIVDPLTGEARGDIVPLFFLLEDEGEEALDGRRGDVVAVRALDQGLRSREKGVSWFGSPSSSLQPWLPLSWRGEMRVGCVVEQQTHLALEVQDSHQAAPRHVFCAFYSQPSVRL